MVVRNMNGIALLLDKRRAKLNMSKNILAKTSKLSRPTVLNMIRTGGFRKGYDINSFLDVCTALDLNVTITPK